MPKLLDYGHARIPNHHPGDISEGGFKMLEDTHLYYEICRGETDLLAYAKFSPDSKDGQLTRIPTVDELVEFLENMAALEIVDRETAGLRALD